MSNLIDNVNNGDAFDYSVNHGSSLNDSSLIHGYVTVVKNAGKDNEETLCKNKHNLLTNAGRDYFHDQCYKNTSAGGAGCNFIALSENSSGAAVGHTAVANEITTGGLNRQVSTPSHSAGTNTTTLVKTFTSSATFTAVQLSGILNASSSGTLGHEATFTSVALVSGDTLQVTWTLTLG